MIRILLADDHSIVRQGLRRMIETADDLSVVVEAGDGAGVLAALRAHELELLLLDMSMPGVSGVDLIKRVKAERPALPILVLSMYDEGQIASRALKAGASGYLTKDSDPSMLMAAIRKVAGGGRFVDPTLIDQLVFGGLDERAPHEALSERERQILALIVAGRPLAQIADELALSAKTVSSYKARIMQKLDIASNADLVRYALEHNLAA